MNNIQFYVLLAAIILFPNIPDFFDSREKKVTKTITRVITQNTPVNKPAQNNEFSPINPSENLTLDDIQSVVETAINKHLNANKITLADASEPSFDEKQSRLNEAPLINFDTGNLEASDIEYNYQSSQELLDNIILSGTFTEENNLSLHHLLQGLPEDKYEQLINQLMTAVNNNEIDLGEQIPLL